MGNRYLRLSKMILMDYLCWFVGKILKKTTKDYFVLLLCIFALFVL